jgi:hypothetical protein
MSDEKTTPNILSSVAPYDPAVLVEGNVRVDGGIEINDPLIRCRLDDIANQLRALNDKLPDKVELLAGMIAAGFTACPTGRVEVSPEQARANGKAQCAIARGIIIANADAKKELHAEERSTD